MKLSWTFYPKPGQCVTLTVIYKPALDSLALPSGGFLHVDTNTAFVDWSTYQRLEQTDLKNRKEAFARLTPVNKGAIELPNGTILRLNS